MNGPAPHMVADVVAHGWRDCGAEHGSGTSQHRFDDAARYLQLVLIENHGMGKRWSFVKSAQKSLDGKTHQSRQTVYGGHREAYAAADALKVELAFLAIHGFPLTTVHLKRLTNGMYSGAGRTKTYTDLSRSLTMTTLLDIMEGRDAGSILERVIALRDRGALFVLNHSGGKDSQAMTAVVRRMVPDAQLIVVHADLGEVEWDGVIEHIEATIGDLPLIVCRNERKTLLEMVERRGQFPSPQQRQCTSDLKRGPIERTIRGYLREHPEFGGLVVNCMGMRAQESSGRSKLSAFKLNEGYSIAGREWYDWLPIHSMFLDEVWQTIADAGQRPHHAYSLGMTRLSCAFCIMSSTADLRTAAIHNPQLYARYVELERRVGRTMMMPSGGVQRGLEEITGILAGEAA